MSERPEPILGFTSAEKLWILAYAVISAVFVAFLFHGGLGSSPYDWLLLSGILLNGFSIFSLFARRSIRRAEHRLRESRRERERSANRL